MQASEKTVFILGRQPELGLAELQSLYGLESVRRSGQAAFLDIELANVDFERLGGSVKLGRVLGRLTGGWQNLEKYLEEELPRQLDSAPEGKFTLGLSVYGLDVKPNQIGRSLMSLKKYIKNSTNRSIRVVPNKSPALSSAQVIHNKLIGLSGWELLAVKDGDQIVLAQTIKVQNIAAYTNRDQARPKRDATVGMLPPKLAQIIINLANPGPNDTVIDPFCGTGVILQEAMLMGNPVVGTDKSQRMVEYSVANIDWLRAMRPELNNLVLVEAGDATNHTWPAPVNIVASETYLGRPLASEPKPGQLKEISSDVNTILSKFLKNLAPQLKIGARVSLAVPAWRVGGEFFHLPLIDHLTDMGYNFVEFQRAPNELVYWRPGQIVGRQLLVLEKI